MKTATGKTISEIRRKQNLTQLAMAKRLKTTAQFVSLMENGRSKLPASMIPTIAANKKDYKAALIKAVCKDFESELRQSL